MTVNTILPGNNTDTLKTLPDNFVDCCVTSPPYYGLRDYGIDGQIGLEETPEEYIKKLVDVFREVKRVLRNDGTLWVNIGDTYSSQRWTGDNKGQPMNKYKDGHRSINPIRKTGLPDKNLIGIPWMFAFALRSDGWILRQDIIWHKPNPMPESVTDRCTRAHEYIFLLSKSSHYYYDHESIKVPVKQNWGTRDRTNWKYGNEGSGLSPQKGMTKSYEMANLRDVWSITTSRFKEAHFATFPEELIAPCIKAGSRCGGVVLDPFMGSGTTAVVAMKLLRKFIGCELNPEYIEIAERRIKDEWGLFDDQGN